MGGNSLDASFYKENELIFFEDGLFGFEDQKRFLPLPMEEGNNDIVCLLSVEDKDLSFVVINPFSVKEDYNPILTKEDYKKLGTTNEANLSYYVVCVIKDVVEESTVNLKCPIIVNVETRRAYQVILQTGDYTFRHSFKEIKRKAG